MAQIVDRRAIPVHVEIEVGVALSFIRDGGLRSGASAFRHLARWLDRASAAREMTFGLPTAKVTPFSEAYPTPWRLADREVVDRDGCNVQDFDDDPDTVQFWRCVVGAVNAAADRGGAMSVERRCRECGIDHIEPGTEIDGEPLCWADDDLCSHCQDRLQAELEQNAKRYRHLRSRPTRAVDMAIGGVFAGHVPDNLILGGEDLDRAVDAEIDAGVSQGETLERRLAQCLADCIDTPLLKVGDLDRSADEVVELRLGSFDRALSERAATLLEEAGL